MSIIGTKATLILAETVKESEYERVKAVDDIGKGLLRRLLEPAMNKPSHRLGEVLSNENNASFRVNNFTAIEILHACNAIAQYEGVATTFCENGAV